MLLIRPLRSKKMFGETRGPGTAHGPNDRLLFLTCVSMTPVCITRTKRIEASFINLHVLLSVPASSASSKIVRCAFLVKPVDPWKAFSTQGDQNFTYCDSSGLGSVSGKVSFAFSVWA